MLKNKSIFFPFLFIAVFFLIRYIVNIAVVYLNSAALQKLLEIQRGNFLISLFMQIYFAWQYYPFFIFI